MDFGVQGIWEFHGDSVRMCEQKKLLPERKGGLPTGPASSEGGKEGQHSKDKRSPEPTGRAWLHLRVVKHLGQLPLQLNLCQRRPPTGLRDPRHISQGSCLYGHGQSLLQEAETPL